jgi:hypothetical protein
MLMDSRPELPMDGFSFDAPRDLVGGKAFAVGMLAM